MLLTVEESSYAGPIPDGEILAATCVGIKQITEKFLKNDVTGEPLEQWEFSFVVNDPASQWHQQRLWGKTSTVFSTNSSCKLRNWLQVLFQMDLPAKLQVDTDDAIGGVCRVEVGMREYEKDGQTKQANFVRDIILPAGASFTPNTEADDPF